MFSAEYEPQNPPDATYVEEIADCVYSDNICPTCDSVSRVSWSSTCPWHCDRK